MSDLTVSDVDPDPTGSVQAIDAAGNATTFDDTPSITSSDESVATASIDDTGAITVTKTGKTGATMLTVSSTRSSDGEVLTGVATLTVAPSEETTLELNLQPGTDGDVVAGADVPAEGGLTQGVDDAAPTEPTP